MHQPLPQGISIFDEQVQDIDAIRQVNRMAFGGEYEAAVVDRIRENCPEILSLAAKDRQEVVGHILFSPVHIIQPKGETFSGMGLGPLAVLPGYQGQGIGAALCQAGLARMKMAGYPFVIVLGHPSYYPRFGFERASIYGISSAFKDVPDEAFMICIFNRIAMAGVSGVAHYRAEFTDTH